MGRYLQGLLESDKQIEKITRHGVLSDLSGHDEASSSLILNGIVMFPRLFMLLMENY